MHRAIKDEVMKYLSHNILYLRKRHNITKKEMANLLRVSTKTLTKIEQGILPPRLSVEVLFKVQEQFGVQLHFLVSKMLDETLFTK